MNIYFCDKNPRLAAQALDDVKLADAALEAATVMSTALFMCGHWEKALGKTANQNHPLMHWIVNSKNNFRWYYHYADSLCEEFKHRFGVHPGTYGTVQQAWNIWNRGSDGKGPVRPMKVELTPFRNVTSFGGFSSNDEVVEANRKELCEKIWGGMSTWSKRSKPTWHYQKYRTGT